MQNKCLEVRIDYDRDIFFDNIQYQYDGNPSRLFEFSDLLADTHVTNTIKLTDIENNIN